MLLLLWLACGTRCPQDQVYSPVFGQCIGEEQATSPPPAPTTAATGDTAAQ